VDFALHPAEGRRNLSETFRQARPPHGQSPEVTAESHARDGGWYGWAVPVGIAANRGPK
jgi:hypothetical protein